jgi:putative transposase
VASLVAYGRATRVKFGGYEQVLTQQQEHQYFYLKEKLILIVSRLKLLMVPTMKELHARFVHWTKPLTSSLLLGTLVDLGRSKSELIAENALLRQQLIMLKRQVKRPACTKADRILLVLLARTVRAWKQTLFIVQPETLLRWHRELFRLYWKRRSKASSHKPKVVAETVALIREMATENRLWGAERIRGELLKLGMHVCKRTIQKYIRQVRTPQPRGQRWATFLHNHATQIWCVGYLAHPFVKWVVLLLIASFFLQLQVFTDKGVQDHFAYLQAFCESHPLPQRG